MAKALLQDSIPRPFLVNIYVRSELNMFSYMLNFLVKLYCFDIFGRLGHKIIFIQPRSLFLAGLENSLKKM